MNRYLLYYEVILNKDIFSTNTVKNSTSCSRKVSESLFEFIQRCDHPDYIKIKDFYNEWINKVPNTERKDIEGRIRSREDSGFRSATFELIVFRCLKSKGYDVSFHPEISNSKKRPDFLVEDKEAGVSFFVEVVCAEEPKGGFKGARKNLMEIELALKKIDTKGNAIYIEYGGRIESQVCRNYVVKLINGWINSGCKGDFNFNECGLTIKANKSKYFTNTKQPYVTEKSNLSPEHIRKKIKQKGNRYGQLEKPFILAVDIGRRSIDEWLIDEVLYGDIVLKSGTGKPITVPDGVFLSKKGRSQYNRISALWLFYNLSSFDPCKINDAFYKNAEASHEVPLFVVNSIKG